MNDARITLTHSTQYTIHALDILKVIKGTVNKLEIFSIWLRFCFLASAVPAPTGSNVVIGDDKANWEAVYKETKNQTDISRSGDQNIFDAILRINARERGIWLLLLFIAW